MAFPAGMAPVRALVLHLFSVLNLKQSQKRENHENEALR